MVHELMTAPPISWLLTVSDAHHKKNALGFLSAGQYLFEINGAIAILNAPPLLDYTLPPS